MLTNDGSTMRIMVQSMGKPSAWSRQKEIVSDNRDKHVDHYEDKAHATEPDASKTAAAKSKQSEVPKNPDKQNTDDSSVIPGDSSVTQQSGSAQEEYDFITGAEINDAAVNCETEGVDGEDAEDGDAEDLLDEGSYEVPAKAIGMKPNHMKWEAGKVNDQKSAANEATTVSSPTLCCSPYHR